MPAMLRGVPADHVAAACHEDAALHELRRQGQPEPEREAAEAARGGSVSFWVCERCIRGLVWTDRDGRVSWRKCDSCGGHGEGYGPGAMFLLALAAVIAFSCWLLQ